MTLSRVIVSNPHYHYSLVLRGERGDASKGLPEGTWRDDHRDPFLPPLQKPREQDATPPTLLGSRWVDASFTS